MDFHSTTLRTVLLSSCLLQIFGDNLETRIQTFSIHRMEDCSDRGEVYRWSVRNLERVSPLVTSGLMRCFCNHHGLWSFSIFKNFRPSFRLPIKSGYSLMELNGKTCESRKVNWRFVQLNSIRHVGNPDSSVRSFSLYTNDSFLGSELSITGNRFSLLKPQEFRSFAFTGGKNWAIFSSKNLKGNFTCLRTVSKSSLIGHNPNVTFLVGSVSFGCPRTVEAGDGKYSMIKSSTFLTLYTKPEAENGSKRADANDSVSFDGTELRFTHSQVFVEFSIKGLAEWTIYEGLEFNGKSRCIATFGQQKVKTGVLRRYRFKRGTNPATQNGEDLLDFGETWLIGSVRFGCFHNSKPQHKEDYEDDLYDYYERVLPIGGEDGAIEWNETIQINSTVAPVLTNFQPGLNLRLLTTAFAGISLFQLLNLW